MPSKERELLSFHPLGAYEVPPLPTVHALRLLLDRMRRLVKSTDDSPFMSDDRLSRKMSGSLGDIVAPPACGPLLDELQLTLSDWIALAKPTEWLKVVILPPCDENRLVERWASRYDYEILQPPDRGDLLGDACINGSAVNGKGVLVIPQLERWFLRHQNGLAQIRALLDQLATLQRHCVIGCNSWAWAFLIKAVDAHMVLPKGITFRAFTARRLHDWFSQLAVEHSTDAISFRSAQTGDDVMATDAQGDPQHDYFAQLAARSAGLPWVAWHLWRRGLRSGSEDNEDSEDKEVDDQVDPTAPGNNDTLWVSKIEEFTLPLEDNAIMLLVLQALLIHGPLSVEELRAVLPVASESNVVHALINAGLVTREADQLQCFAAAYPAVRGALATAGFSIDRL